MTSFGGEVQHRARDTAASEFGQDGQQRLGVAGGPRHRADRLGRRRRRRTIGHFLCGGTFVVGHFDGGGAEEVRHSRRGDVVGHIAQGGLVTRDDQVPLILAAVERDLVRQTLDQASQQSAHRHVVAVQPAHAPGRPHHRAVLRFQGRHQRVDLCRRAHATAPSMRACSSRTTSAGS
jgi:hypothetical protein